MSYKFGLFVSILAMLVSVEGASVSTPAESQDYQQFPFAVQGISSKMLYADFWINQLEDGDKVIMDWDEIAKYNQQNYAQAPSLVDIANHPTQLTKSEVELKINSISKVPTSPRYYLDGRQATADELAQYVEMCNISAVPESVTVGFGLAVERKLLRTFPTNDTLCNSGKDPEIDMFTETTIYPGEPVAILHTSLDGKWLLVQKYNYLAWIEADAIAIGSKNEVCEYINAPEFLVVTGAKVRSTFNPVNSAVSEREFDMGCRMPLATELPSQLIDRQGVDYCFVVILPVRDNEGKLDFSYALIQRSADVNVGYLPLTKANILRQAFKFVGERYGWGDANNSRDCSGFVLSTYSSFGVVLPRNGGQQEKHTVGILQDLNDKNSAERLLLLNQMEVGDTMASPSHIMMYIGKYDGELYMIHDYMGSGFMVDGEYISSTSRSVGVTPIVSFMVSGGKRHYYEFFTGLKRFILTDKQL